MISVGFSHSCFSKSGVVTCVGKICAEQDDNQDENYECASIPDAFNSSVDMLVSGYYHVCLRKPGELICIGDNDEGQSDVPDEYKTGADQVKAGEKHTCFLKNKNVTCVGNN